jgi:membrane protease YdiL (CAAX protease family)
LQSMVNRLSTSASLNAKKNSGVDMRTWITKRPVISYYALTIALTWGYWLTLIAQGKQVVPGSSTSHLPGLLGPLVAAFVITAITEGRSGIIDLSGRMVRWRSAWPRGVLLALSPLAIAGTIFAGLYLLGTPLPSLARFQSYPGLSIGLPFWVMLLLVLIVNGFGEEVGWRGFMTEKLLLRYNPFQTTVLVAGFWILWHVPVFWLNQSMAALIGPMLVGWALGLVCGAFVLAHLYLYSGRSILVIALWHANYNIVVAVPAAEGVPAAAVSTVVMVWGVVVAWIWWKDTHKKKVKRSE